MKTSELSTSKYLKQADVERPQVVNIERIAKENVAIDGQQRKDRGVVYFREFSKGVVLNTTNLRRLESLFGLDTDLWVDQKVVLYVDPEVSYGGETVGGLRMRAVPKKPAAKSAPKPAPELADYDDAEPVDHFAGMKDDLPFKLGEQG